MPKNASNKKTQLILEDGTVFHGHFFGSEKLISGEVVFNTGMVGYTEALTDPSYYGQILVLTYPLIGNYGVPCHSYSKDFDRAFESERIQIAGLIVSENSENHNHWSATKSIDQWLKEEDVPGLAGVDTRALTKHLRERGNMLGKICDGDGDVEFYDPNEENLVAAISVQEPIVYNGGKKRVIVIDCGCKNSIIGNLLDRDITVIRVPWNYDFLDEKIDGLLISNGPGNPKMCGKTISYVQNAMNREYPIFGICLGNQILALAAGADTYKMKFGHRSQNQPCIKVGSPQCFITSQNHSYAIDSDTLPNDWEIFFKNANDGSNEGIRHISQPFFSVQFHPEAAPGPVDTNFLFEKFLGML